MEENKSWYVVYTKSRYEKKVFEQLTLKGIEAYCPLNKVRKKYTDRFKIIEEPLFKSYVFVNLNEKEKLEVRLTFGVVNFVYWLRKPAIVALKDIITIKKYLNEYEHVSVEYSEKIVPGQTVIIKTGIFLDRKAVVTSIKKNKITAELESLGCKIIAEVEQKDVITI
jgi:transcription antitermination factor NusG